MTRILAYILLLQLLSYPLFAQNREYFFTHYGKREGLASNEASSIVQDEKGFLWIGTLDGLQRYDGTRFLTFRKSQDSTYKLPSNYIISLYFDKHNRLWISFGNGKVGIFDTKKFRFSEVPLESTDAVPAQRRKQLLEDVKGNMYVVTPPYVFYYDSAGHKFLNAKDRIKIPPGWRLSAMMPDPLSQKFWIAADSGLAVFNGATGKLNYRNHNIENERAIELAQHLRSLLRMQVDKKGRIWLKAFPRPYTGYVIHTVDPNKDSVVNHTLKDQVSGFHDPWGFFVSKNGTVWLRGFRVLAEYIERDGKFKAIDNNVVNDWGIHFETTNDLFEDREQNIWVPTFSNGIYRFNPTTDFFKAVRFPEGNDKILSSVVYMRDGGLLVSVVDDKMYRYDSQLNTIPVNIPALSRQVSVYSLFQSKDNRSLLIGGTDGLYIYDQVENKTTHFNASRFDNGVIIDIFEDGPGNFWAYASERGLYKCDKSGNITKIDSFPAVQDLSGHFTDYEGNLWVSTLSNGLYKIDPHTNKVLKQVVLKGAPLFNIRCMAPVNDSSLLLGSYGLLLYDIARDSLQEVNLGGELLANIQSIEKDRSGRFWAGLSNGLCRLDLRRKSIMYFDRNDGMVNDGFWMAVSNVLPDGRMVFGTQYSFLVFDPEQIENRSLVTVPLYTGFSIANRPLSVDSLLLENAIHLDRENNSIVIEFSGMSFRKDFKISYMLEGLDKEWCDANELNEAVYNYLPAGTYTFRLKTEDDDGLIAEANPLKIKVHPPFWLTWWFYGIVALVLALVFYWLDKVKVEKRRALQDMRSQIAGDLHHEINVTLNNIYMLSEMARIKADNNAPLSKEYIGQIHDKSRTMITAMDDILWSIKPENDSMEKTFERMRELAGALSSGFDADISLNIPARARSLNLDIKHRLLFFLLFKDALQVVVAFGKGKRTEIDIDAMKGNLLLRMQDDTANMEGGDENVGAILKTMQDRVDQLNGELHLKTGAGLMLQIRTPIK